MVGTNQILVIGGTGLVGGAVARQLVRDGYSVRVFTRNGAAARAQADTAYTIVQGSVEDEASLTRALAGCAGVHLSLPSGHKPQELERVQHQAAARIARLAAACGVEHLTYTSGYLVSEQFARIPAERAKLHAEAAIRKSGVPFTIFRPTYFTDLLSRFVQGKRASIFGKQPHPIRFLALSDYARMISQAHKTRGANQSLFASGPEAMTFERALGYYVERALPGVKVSHSPFWMMNLINRMFLKGEITEILQLMAATERVGEIGDPSEANRLFGAPKTTVCDWVAQQMV